MKIFIRQLELEAIIGLLPEEREKPQRIIVDLELEYDYDSKRSTYLDYGWMRNQVISLLQSEKFELLEDAATQIKHTLISSFPEITTMNLSLTKPDIFVDCQVGVTI